MGKPKSVGVREFRNNASTYLSCFDLDAVNKRGQVIGCHFSLERNQDEVRSATTKLSATMGTMLENMGISEEELAQLFVLR